MPWLPVKEDRLCPRVSKKKIIIIIFFFFLLKVFLGKDDGFAKPVPLPNGGA